MEIKTGMFFVFLKERDAINGITEVAEDKVKCLKIRPLYNVL